MPEIFVSYKQLGSRKMVVTSHFRPEMVILHMGSENAQYNPYFLICGRIAEISTCCKKLGSINTILASDFYRNSSVIVELDMGRYHIPQNIFLVFF